MTEGPPATALRGSLDPVWEELRSIDHRYSNRPELSERLRDEAIEMHLYALAQEYVEIRGRRGEALSCKLHDDEPHELCPMCALVHVNDHDE